MYEITRVERNKSNINERIVPLNFFYNEKIKKIRITDYHVGVADWNYTNDSQKMLELIVKGYDIEIDVISNYHKE